MVLDLYFGPFWDKSEVMFFQKMAICEYLILAIFSRFWLFWAHFGPEMSKVYLFQLFRCKINNKIKKSGSIWLFQKLDPQSAPKSTQDPKTPLKGLRRAKIGTNASHSVQLTTLGPKKPDLNPTPQRSVPFTWNPPGGSDISLAFFGIAQCCPPSKLCDALAPFLQSWTALTTKLGTKILLIFRQTKLQFLENSWKYFS